MNRLLLTVFSLAAIACTGPVGPKGPQGDQGLQGLQGERGDQGETGATGDPGAAGLQGDQGVRGPIGPAGGGLYATRQDLYCRTTTITAANAPPCDYDNCGGCYGPCGVPVEASCDSADDLAQTGGCKNPSTSTVDLLMSSSLAAALSGGDAGSATPARQTCTFTNANRCLDPNDPSCGDNATLLGAAATICCLRVTP